MFFNPMEAWYEHYFNIIKEISQGKQQNGNLCFSKLDKLFRKQILDLTYETLPFS